MTKAELMRVLESERATAEIETNAWAPRLSVLARMNPEQLEAAARAYVRNADRMHTALRASVWVERDSNVTLLDLESAQLLVRVLMTGVHP